MKLVDLSQPIYDGAPNCPVHPPVSSKIIADHDADHWRMELLTLASHTGSHVDAPLHKLKGAPSLDGIPLDRFVGPAAIADLRGIEADTPIGSDRLAPSLSADLKDTIVLLVTGWGDRRAATDEWHLHSPYLSPEGAEWLVRKGIRAVGIDHYSIGGSRDPDNSRTHEILLGAGLWVLEDLRFPEEAFAAVLQGARLWSLPVNLKGHTGAFCRPVLEIL